MKKTDDSFIPDVGVTHLPIEVIDMTSRKGFVSHANYKGPKGEVFTKPSMTVPDMSISLREMLDRHLHGNGVKTFAVSNVPLNSELIPDNLERMNSLDKAELAQRTADFIATTRGRMISAREARRRAEFEALIDKRAQERIAAKLGLDGAAAPSE